MKYCPNCGKPIKQKWNICPYCGEDLSKYKKDKPSPISFGENNVVVKPSFEDIKQTIMEIENMNVSAIDEEKFSELIEQINTLLKKMEDRGGLSSDEIDRIIDMIGKKLEEGERKFKKPIGDAETYIKLGNRAFDNGAYEVAIEYYDKALEIDPTNVNAWNNKGNALKNLGKYNEAIKCFDKALEINPKFKLARRNRKIALEKLRHE